MSEWTEEGFEYFEAMTAARAPLNPTPGEHSIVKEHPTDGWLTLPALPELKTLPHRWVLVRRQKPMVPVFRKQKLPSAKHTTEENARLCNVYMRPWTLNKALATHDVMYLGELSAPIETVPARHDATPSVVEQEDSCTPTETVSARRDASSPSSVVAALPRPYSHAASWDRYVRGNIISKHARRYIVNLLNTCCIHDRGADEEDGK